MISFGTVPVPIWEDVVVVVFVVFVLIVVLVMAVVVVPVVGLVFDVQPFPSKLFIAKFYEKIIQIFQINPVGSLKIVP